MQVEKNWKFSCHMIDDKRIKDDAYIEVSWDCDNDYSYSISILLTYCTKENDYEYLFNNYLDEDDDKYYIWNECVRAATEIAHDHNIKLIVDEAIRECK